MCDAIQRAISQWPIDWKWHLIFFLFVKCCNRWFKNCWSIQIWYKMRERIECNCCQGKRIESNNSIKILATWIIRSSTMVQLVAMLMLLIGLADSHPHVASNTRLPAEFANHYPHHQTNNPAFRVFYGTGVSLPSFLSLCLLCKTTSFTSPFWKKSKHT